MNPPFSIIIPTYNRAERLSEAIDSVFNQKHQNFELIIVDDGSTDHTEKVVSSFKDDRIKYFHKKNEERAVARNYGIAKSIGKYITFLDSDDQLYPNHLEHASSLILKNNSPEWLHLGYEVKDESGNIYWRVNDRNAKINDSLLTGNHLSCIGVFVRNDTIKANNFNEDPHLIGSEDYELWLRLASKYPLYYSNKITSCIIQHGSRSVENFDKMQLIERINKNIFYTTQNPDFQRRFGHKSSTFIAHRYIYLANHLSRASHKITSFKYYFLSVINSPLIIFHRNSFSYLKSLILQKK